MPLVPCTGIFPGAIPRSLQENLYLQSVHQYRRLDPRQEVHRGGPGGLIQAYYDEWDEAALRGIIQRQRKITETSKKLEMKKLYQVLIICDNFADSPQLHKPHGALDTLFLRGRHLQISTWVGSQKLRLISAAVRVNQQFLCAGGCATSTSWTPSSKS